MIDTLMIEFRDKGMPLRVFTILLMLLVALPLIAIGFIALSGDFDSLAHIVKFVLPKSFFVTIFLMLGVALLAGTIGTVCAWLLMYYQFPGRSLFIWMLVLPLAVPTYLAAYTHVEFFSFTGPVQSMLRNVFGFSSSRDYWFPEIRSLIGAIFILSLVLFPYVYLATVALFRLQSRQFVEAARMLNTKPGAIFFQVLLPLARPATIAGISLCLMEAMNDIGAVEYLGVETLTFAVYSTWINKSDLVGAAQLTLVIFIVVAVLFILERIAHHHRKLFEANTGSVDLLQRRQRLSGTPATLAFLACALPILFGFLVPLIVLVGYLYKRMYLFTEAQLIKSIWTSSWLSALSALICVLIALVLAFAVRAVSNSRYTKKSQSAQTVFVLVSARLCTLGYAVPGTILALGLFIPFARFDNFLNTLSVNWFSVSLGLVFSGSGALIVYAYVVRFLAVADGNINAGLSKLSPSLDHAGRILGRSSHDLLFSVHLPILLPSIAITCLLVFIESMKELSATLFLRPFGLNTLATHLYEKASQSQVEQGAAAALIIMCLGIVPVLLVARTSLRA